MSKGENSRTICETSTYAKGEERQPDLQGVIAVLVRKSPRARVCDGVAEREDQTYMTDVSELRTRDIGPLTRGDVDYYVVQPS